MEPFSGPDTLVLQALIIGSGSSVAVAAAFMLVASAATMLILFRPLRREALLSHPPIILEIVPALCAWVATGLPELFPRAFATIIGHSIYDYDPRLNGTWVAEVWVRSLAFGALTLFAIGLPWAIWNVALGRAILSNVLALAVFLVWLFFAFLGFTGHFSGYL